MNREVCICVLCITIIRLVNNYYFSMAFTIIRILGRKAVIFITQNVGTCVILFMKRFSYAPDTFME